MSLAGVGAVHGGCDLEEAILANFEVTWRGRKEESLMRKAEGKERVGSSGV
jgi:hypothetical protein